MNVPYAVNIFEGNLEAEQTSITKTFTQYTKQFFFPSNLMSPSIFFLNRVPTTRDWKCKTWETENCQGNEKCSNSQEKLKFSLKSGKFRDFFFNALSYMKILLNSEDRLARSSNFSLAGFSLNSHFYNKML